MRKLLVLGAGLPALMGAYAGAAIVALGVALFLVLRLRSQRCDQSQA